MSRCVDLGMLFYVTISKYYEDGGGGGATQSERTVLHHDGLSDSGEYPEYESQLS